ncbi:MAG: 4-hydroxythreonine-4-phosphate dehydrogenase PdxA [Proteobacteria bacterium]|nr:4-hydroxythreonine-4-phosphate dehydrogenase PdxA [Pseudomonadota bacterium]
MRLAVSMGDPCGIGPEIIVRAAASGKLGEAIVVGDAAVLARAAAALNLPPPPHVWAPPGLPEGLVELPLGQVHARAGAAAAACVRGAVALVQQGAAGALVTAPLHKAALAAAGEPYPGHTELLQAMTQPPAPVRMMLANDELRVVLATIHVSLRRAIALLDAPLVLETLRITHAALRQWGIAAPRIAVAGLNPHAGEDGLFGDEEIHHIAPAVAQARAEGMDASGPYPPDTIFMRARRGAFDVVVAMTHDHGLIPVKYLGVADGVNVTLGLPWVRTSPDHGTAFDIAGRGLADASSLQNAAALARRLASGQGRSG